MHLLLARHGETEWNVQKRIQGWTNSALTVTGLQQIELLGLRLASVPIAAVHCSDSERTQQTARAVIGDRDISLTVSSELRETSWGSWEGKTAGELAESEPELWAKFVERGHQDPGADQADWEKTTLVPMGESVHAASNRINASVYNIIEQYRDTEAWILVVGHGGSLRFVIASLLKMRPYMSRQFHLDNASLCHFTVDEKRTVLKLLNDSSHWTGAEIL